MRHISAEDPVVLHGKYGRYMHHVWMFMDTARHGRYKGPEIPRQTENQSLFHGSASTTVRKETQRSRITGLLTILNPARKIEVEIRDNVRYPYFLQYLDASNEGLNRNGSNGTVSVTIFPRSTGTASDDRKLMTKFWICFDIS